MARTKRELPDFVHKLVEDLAGEVARAFNRPVKIRFGGVSASNNAFEGSALNFDIDPDRLKRIRSEDLFKETLRGSVYQHAAHLLSPADAQHADAGEAQYVFAVLNDEHAMRNAASAQQDWQPPMQSLVDSVLFKSRPSGEKLQVPTIAGRAVDEPARYTVSATPEYAARFNRWAYSFRRHESLSDKADPAVREALQMAQNADLKSLSKDDLLKLAQDIHNKLAEGIEPEKEPVAEPEPAVEAPVEAVVHAAPPPPVEYLEPVFTRRRPDPKPEAPAETAAAVVEEEETEQWWHNRKVQAVGALAGFFFAAFFAKFGANFWLFVGSGVTLFAAAVAIGALYYRNQVDAVAGTLLGTVRGTLRMFRRGIGRGLAAIRSGAQATCEAIGTAAAAVGRFFRHPVTKGICKVLAVLAAGVTLFLILYYLPFWVFFFAFAGFGFVALVVIQAGDGRGTMSSSYDPGAVAELKSQTSVVLMKLSVALFAASFAFGLYELLVTFGIAKIIMFALSCVGFVVVFGYASVKIAPSQGKTIYARNEPAIQQFCDSFKELAKAAWALIKIVGGGIGGVIAAIAVFAWGYIWGFLVASAILIRNVAILVAMGTVAAAKWTNLTLKMFGWNIEPHLMNAWANVYCRVFLLAGPPLGLGYVMVWAILSAAAKSNWLLFVPMLAALVIMSVSIALNFRKLLDLAANQVFVALPELAGTAQGVPLDLTTTDWTPITDIRPVHANPAVLAELMPKVQACSRPVREGLERLGERTKDRDDQLSGGAIGEEGHKVFTGNMGIWQENLPVQLPSVDVRVIGDCSSSENLESPYFKPGEKFRTVQTMAMVAEHAMASVSKRVSGGLYGYVDSVIFDAGKPGEWGVTGLVCRGGNNDTAALDHARKASLASSQDIKIIIVINDAQPADCSARSFNDMVAQCRREGIFVIQMLTDDTHPAAPGAYVINLCRVPPMTAATQLGQILLAIGEEVMG